LSHWIRRDWCHRIPHFGVHTLRRSAGVEFEKLSKLEVAKFIMDVDMRRTCVIRSWTSGKKPRRKEEMLTIIHLRIQI
jgi:hypothetical protein